MPITDLRIHNVRSFQDTSIQLAPGFNIFFGKNGAGKTSILESIDLLSRGRSFRANQISEIIRNTTSTLAVALTLNHDLDQETTLGLNKHPDSTKLTVNGNKALKWSEITQHLPIISIHPESYLCITGGPGERRKFIDWGLFHVEPSFRKHWSAYMKAVKQRNASLKRRNIEEARYWHHALAEHGQVITDSRAAYSVALNPLILEFQKKLGLPHTVDFKYMPGWNQEVDLMDALELELKQNDQISSTRAGPHRADLEIKWMGERFANSSSRGQQKSLTIAMYLAQSEHLKVASNKKSIYLVDELPAELDQESCQKVINLLESLETQVLITTVSDHPLKKQLTQQNLWFHVEQGQVNSMV